MAEKKKRKSIYDRPLKDINKDGKVNFGDTWLGDALGFDGKMGVQKGRPGLRASMKGARRGKDSESESKPAKGSSSRKRPQARPAKPSSRLDTKGETPKGPRSSTGGPARYRGRGSKTTDTGMDDKAAATRRGTTRPTTKQEAKPKPKKEGGGVEGAINRSNERQQSARARVIQANKQERSNTPTRAEINAWIKKQPASWLKDNPTAAGRNAAARKALSGMAKGGMTQARYQQNGGRDYKKSGMFYKSSSPRGYK